MLSQERVQVEVTGCHGTDCSSSILFWKNLKKKNQMLLTWRRTYDLWLLIRILYHLALGDLWELCFYKGHFTIVPLYFANRAPFLPLDPSLGRSSTLLLFSYTRLVMFSTEISFFLSGDSIVVAPSQTLSNQEYHMLRETALKVTSVNEQQSLLCSTHFPLRRTVRLATWLDFFQFPM